jgi:hypothetical protein
MFADLERKKSSRSTTSSLVGAWKGSAATRSRFKKLAQKSLDISHFYFDAG